jgi:hypothetical protein
MLKLKKEKNTNNMVPHLLKLLIQAQEKAERTQSLEIYTKHSALVVYLTARLRETK